MHIRQLLWKMLSGTLTGPRLRASDKEIIKLEKFVITGGKPLHGEVTISGAKNAAVGVLPATILAADVCVIENLPDISDVAVSLKILSVLGAQIKMINRNTYEIDTTHLTGTNVPDDLSRQMRASYYFLGALLSRFGKAQVAMPGGCNLGPRPIDQHLKVFSALGAEDSVDYGMITVRAKEMNGALALNAFAFTFNFFVNSPFPKILTPSLGFLTIPASIKASTDTSAPSSNLSKAERLIPTISLEFLHLKPLLGIRLYKGICPPSNPGLTPPPERAFCPLCPLPAVFPFPEPCPRPLLKASLCLDPSAGRKFDNSIPLHLLAEYY